MRPLLSQADVDSIHQQLSADDLPWLDGRLTAGEQAASVKKNHQLDPESPLAIQVANSVSKALKADPLIKSFALIRKVHSVLICLLYTSPSPRDRQKSRMPSSA